MSEKDRNTRDLCRRQSPPSLVSSTNPATWCKWRLGITGREISVWRIWVLVWGGGVKHIYFCASFFPERVWVFVIFPLSIAAEKKKSPPTLSITVFLLLASEIRWELLFIALVCLAGIRHVSVTLSEYQTSFTTDLVCEKVFTNEHVTIYFLNSASFLSFWSAKWGKNAWRIRLSHDILNATEAKRNIRWPTQLISVNWRQNRLRFYQ